jgi:hypothetical protein
MRGGKLALILTMTTLATGCLATTPSDVTASEAPRDAPTSAGSGGYALRVHVTDEPHGMGLAGARVVVSWVAGSWWGGETRDAVTLATDGAGFAEAHVPTGGEARVSAYREGFTEETRRNVPLGSAGNAVQVEMPLYQSRVTLWANGSLSPAAASFHREGFNDFRWDPHALQFGAGDEARRGYAARLVLLNFTLAWENTPTAAGDLGIGVGRQTDQPDVVQDANAQQLPPGRYEEKLALTLGDVRRAHWQSADALQAGAGTGTAYVAPAGLPYTLKVDAVFDGNQALRESPGPNALWGALVALGGVALALPRRP